MFGVIMAIIKGLIDIIISYSKNRKINVIPFTYEAFSGYMEAIVSSQKLHLFSPGATVTNTYSIIAQIFFWAWA
jgi:hypothetical protein